MTGDTPLEYGDMPLGYDWNHSSVAVYDGMAIEISSESLGKPSGHRTEMARGFPRKSRGNHQEI